MRQKANGGLPWLRQQTPSAPGDTLFGMNIAPMAFSMNQSSAVCLPLVSDSQTLMWVHSNEINLQPDGTSELDKAFNRFPYLTQKQTAALAQRCSLHPDQVKVWFMVQRLRYGISWDCKDIPAVRRMFKSSREKEKQQNSKGEEIKEPEGRMVGENVQMNERREREIQQGKQMKVERDRGVEEGKINTEKKQKRMTVGKKKTKKLGESVVGKAEEMRCNEAEMNCHKATQCEIKPFSRNKKKEKAACDVPPLTDSEAESATDDSTLKELLEMSDKLVVADGSPIITQQHLACAHTATKMQIQLEMMREAFSHSQYPDGEDYNRLAMVINVPRRRLVKWFCDKRYYIKKRGKPDWMSQEQHCLSLANIRNRQCRKTRISGSQRNGKTTWKMKFDRSESCGEGERFPGLQSRNDASEGVE